MLANFVKLMLVFAVSAQYVQSFFVHSGIGNASKKDERADSVFAGSGRYGYGKKEMKIISRHLFCKRLETYCLGNREDINSFQKRAEEVKEFLRAIHKLERIKRSSGRRQQILRKSISFQDEKNTH